jgi:hypothetical protein
VLTKIDSNHPLIDVVSAREEEDKRLVEAGKDPSLVPFPDAVVNTPLSATVAAAYEASRSAPSSSRPTAVSAVGGNGGSGSSIAAALAGVRREHDIEASELLSPSGARNGSAAGVTGIDTSNWSDEQKAMLDSAVYCNRVYCQPGEWYSFTLFPLFFSCHSTHFLIYFTYVVPV